MNIEEIKDEIEHWEMELTLIQFEEILHPNSFIVKMLKNIALRQLNLLYNHLNQLRSDRRNQN